MENLKFRVSFDGPDVDGFYIAKIGQYIACSSRKMDDDIKRDLSKQANQRANIIFEADDDVLAKAQGVEAISVRCIKDDLMKYIISPINMAALKCYKEAQLLGQPRRNQALQKVREGIACFESLDDALRDAEENIQRYTKSDFPAAHFYEVVKAEVLALKTANEPSSPAD